MVREYAREHQSEFASEQDAFLGGVIAGIAGSEGSRIAVLLATVDTGSVDRFFDPEEAGHRFCLFPLAMRICGGHSDGEQVFLAEARLNCGVSAVMRNSLPGLFHVTTAAGWEQIAIDGRIIAGVDLCSGGRHDTQIMVSPPYPDDLSDSKRLEKGPRNAGQVIISIDPAGLVLGDARINQQGYILQRSPIPWRFVDYAMRIIYTQDGVQTEFLMLNADFGQPEIIEGTGCSIAEWYRKVHGVPAWGKYNLGKPAALTDKEAYARVADIVSKSERGPNG